MSDEPTDFVCRTHGVYGSEFPYADTCGYCAREAKLVSGERERCIKAVEDEPELPGDMPDEMWEAIRNDRDAVSQAFVIAVRQTKDEIIRRIRA